MKLTFSTKWSGSVQPRKQRKYVANAPLHLKKQFMHSHLSTELRTKYGTRSIQIRKGDKVKVLRGDHKGKEGKIELVSIKKQYVHVTGVDYLKKDSSKAFYPLKTSNLLVVDLELSDKKRKAKLESKKTNAVVKKTTPKVTKQGEQ
jgi:large subunit ribosomal protein L24